MGWGIEEAEGGGGRSGRGRRGEAWGRGGGVVGDVVRR